MLQRQARALGDASRLAIFRHLAAAGRAIDVAELTDLLGVHHTAVRQHLARLIDSGLVVETTGEPRGRGRPRLLYRPAPDAPSRWGAVGPYERLAEILSDAIRTGHTPRDAGREYAHRRRPRAGVGAVAALVDDMAQQGFAPQVETADDGRFDIVLTDCPFESAARHDSATVCSVHLGMALGVADQIPALTIDELVPKLPDATGCRLACHVTDASAESASGVAGDI